jgi:phosphopantothenoylcysteine decarboxylase / phosphopantothenate---cysteine ligase
MLTSCKAHFREVDIAIFAAAVADYRPKVFYEQKIKKSEQLTTVEFIINPDMIPTGYLSSSRITCKNLTL